VQREIKLFNKAPGGLETDVLLQREKPPRKKLESKLFKTSQQRLVRTCYMSLLTNCQDLLNEFGIVLVSVGRPPRPRPTHLYNDFVSQQVEKVGSPKVVPKTRLIGVFILYICLYAVLGLPSLRVRIATIDKKFVFNGQTFFGSTFHILEYEYFKIENSL